MIDLIAGDDTLRSSTEIRPNTMVTFSAAPLGDLTHPVALCGAQTAGPGPTMASTMSK
jgi:hypothetical protein